MNIDQLIELLVDTLDQDVPVEAIENAKRLILDFIAVSLAGCSDPGACMIADYAHEYRCAEAASLIGFSFGTSAPLAALVNGTTAHALDYDDYSHQMGAHPTAAILPAVIALAEYRNLPGLKVLVSYIFGLEVAAKLGEMVWRQHMDKGWHVTGTVGSIGAAAAAARLLGLNIEQSRAAIGIAASLASGIRQNFGTMVKPLHAGNAARNGVEAALLAEKGFTAARDALEARYGFVSTFAGGKALDLSGIGLFGKPYSIVSPGIGIKLYPSCGTTHPGIDAALYIRQHYRIVPEDIAEIEMTTHPDVPKVLAYSRPQTGAEARFSLEYCLARALVTGRVTLEDFRDERIKDPQIDSLIQKARYQHPNEKTPYNWATGLRIRLKDETTISHEVKVSKGDPARPLSWAEVQDKYEACASTVLGKQMVNRVFEIVTDLEHEKGISNLMRLISCPNHTTHA